MRRALQILGAVIAFLLLASSSLFAITYEYDQLNRLKKVTYDNGTVIEFTYDAAGNRTAKRINP
ncbi:MAG: RHS repeat domain-containing protein [Planctomycetota bacterium]